MVNWPVGRLDLQVENPYRSGEQESPSYANRGRVKDTRVPPSARASAQILYSIGDNGTIQVASAVEFKRGVRCVDQGGGAASTVDGYLVGAGIENLKIGGHQRRVGKGRSGKVDGAGSRHVHDDLRIRWRAGPRDGVDIDLGISIRGQAVGIDVNGGPSGGAGWRNEVQVSLNRNVAQ